MVPSRKLHTLVIPGLATLAAHGLVIALFYSLGIFQKTLWKEPTFSLPVYAVFWSLWIPIGALGAYLSRRGGGGRAHRLLAALFLPAGKVIGYVILAPLVMAISGLPSFHYVYGGWEFILVKYIFAPSLALALGAVPFLRETKH